MTDRNYDDWEIKEDSNQAKALYHDDGQIHLTKRSTSPGQPWEEWKATIRKDGETVEDTTWEADPEEGIWPTIEKAMEVYWDEE